MTNLVEFLAGQQDKNRKGVYKVLKVQVDAMFIRWKDREVVNTTVTMLSHIVPSV